MPSALVAVQLRFCVVVLVDLHVRVFGEEKHLQPKGKRFVALHLLVLKIVLLHKGNSTILQPRDQKNGTGFEQKVDFSQLKLMKFLGCLKGVVKVAVQAYLGTLVTRSTQNSPFSILRITRPLLQMALFSQFMQISLIQCRSVTKLQSNSPRSAVLNSSIFNLAGFSADLGSRLMRTKKISLN